LDDCRVPKDGTFVRRRVTNRCHRESARRRGGLRGFALSARLRDLEAAGVVRGYHADVDVEAVGSAFAAIVFVMMREGTEDGRRLRGRRR
jgi:hypothetical protein